MTPVIKASLILIICVTIGFSLFYFFYKDYQQEEKTELLGKELTKTKIEPEKVFLTSPSDRSVFRDGAVEINWKIEAYKTSGWVRLNEFRISVDYDDFESLIDNETSYVEIKDPFFIKQYKFSDFIRLNTGVLTYYTATNFDKLIYTSTNNTTEINVYIKLKSTEELPRRLILFTTFEKQNGNFVTMSDGVKIDQRVICWQGKSYNSYPDVQWGFDEVPELYGNQQEINKTGVCN